MGAGGGLVTTLLPFNNDDWGFMSASVGSIVATPPNPTHPAHDTHNTTSISILTHVSLCFSPKTLRHRLVSKGNFALRLAWLVLEWLIVREQVRQIVYYVVRMTMFFFSSASLLHSKQQTQQPTWQCTQISAPYHTHTLQLAIQADQRLKPITTQCTVLHASEKPCKLLQWPTLCCIINY